MNFLMPLLTATTLALAFATGAIASDAAHPVVVELFQSQGCSSCPPANANVLAISDRPEVLALSFGVTYWDQLGWKDTFASPVNTARQWDYARGLHHAQVFTPQVVVNGRSDGVGADRRELDRLLVAGDRGIGGPAIQINADRVTLSMAAAPREVADVWLVRYDPRVVQVAIRRGENGGRTLPHKNVVRQLVHLGTWRGTAESLTLPVSRDPLLRSAILIQQGVGGPILAAAKG